MPIGIRGVRQCCPSSWLHWVSGPGAGPPPRTVEAGRKMIAKVRPRMRRTYVPWRTVLPRLWSRKRPSMLGLLVLGHVASVLCPPARVPYRTPAPASSGARASVTRCGSDRSAAPPSAVDASRSRRRARAAVGAGVAGTERRPVPPLESSRRGKGPGGAHGVRRTDGTGHLGQPDDEFPRVLAVITFP